MPIQWYPKKLAELDNWYVEFVIQCNNYKTPLATVLTAGVLTQLAANRDMIIALKQGLEAAHHYQRDIVQYAGIVAAGRGGTGMPVAPVPPAAITVPLGAIADIEKYTLNLVKQIKAHPAYTPAMGAAMGIIGSASPPGQPKVIVAAQGGSVVKVSLVKARNKQIALTRSVNNGPWSLLTVMTRRTYLDNSPPLVPGAAEVRHYKAQGYDNGNLVGPVSAEVSIATTP